LRTPLNQLTHTQKQHDFKKLNEEVFRKLMRVQCLDSWLHYNGKYGFCIPINPKAFSSKTDQEFLDWNRTNWIEISKNSL
jgi:hypothetical protein